MNMKQNVVDCAQHVAAVGEPGEFVRPRNQVEFHVRLFELLRPFPHFLFEHFAVRVQFRNLALDGPVHDIEVFRQDADFVLPLAEIDIFGFDVAFGNLDGVDDELAHGQHELAVEPHGNKQYRDERSDEHDLAYEQERGYLRIDFFLGLQREQADIVDGVVYVVG